MPMIVAVNKIDKEGADPARVRSEMTTLGLQPVEWGGDIDFVDVSARTKEGLDDLLDTIVAQAELMELRANPDAAASGTVIESKLDSGRGPVVTILIMRGTLEVGDALVAGATGDASVRCTTSSATASARRSPASRSRCSVSKGFPRPASGSGRSTATGAPSSLPTSGSTASRPSRSRAQRQAGLARGHLQERCPGAQPGAQVRRRRLAGGDRGRDREAAPGRGVGQRDPPRGRRRDRVRRDARGRVGRRDPRVQRATGRRCARGRRTRGRRRSATTR